MALGSLKRIPLIPCDGPRELKTSSTPSFQGQPEEHRVDAKRSAAITKPSGVPANRGPPNYIPPNPPISAAERGDFTQFHGPRTQMYSSVLPGEIVRQCVTGIVAGTLDPVAQLHMEHLIVDEFQDLNPIDLQFVDAVLHRGVTTFAAGDDDQSIYSFRFASPVGIQAFTGTYAAAGHSLADCFRCTPAVTEAATALVNAFALPNRIPKHSNSLYGASATPVQGRVIRWRFTHGSIEARAIAESCRALIAAGSSPRDILILLSNTRQLLPDLKTAFESAGVPLDPLNDDGYLDSPTATRVCLPAHFLRSRRLRRSSNLSRYVAWCRRRNVSRRWG